VNRNLLFAKVGENFFNQLIKIFHFPHQSFAKCCQPTVGGWNILISWLKEKFNRLPRIQYVMMMTMMNLNCELCKRNIATLKVEANPECFFFPRYKKLRYAKGKKDLCLCIKCANAHIRNLERFRIEYRQYDITPEKIIF